MFPLKIFSTAFVLGRGEGGQRMLVVNQRGPVTTDLQRNVCATGDVAPYPPAVPLAEYNYPVECAKFMKTIHVPGVC